ncbi:DUF1566 domain-containing protein [Rheinheimera baltica]|uniref:DUF1566 domain-containing protein n=1 Tax=Rheinheimera baltica TaxID=67576 RepID=A0ABT9I1R9_9GAMM|nr:DUF1566 domain-containing protein [Rheinheimera baltica]MDP5137332.1 DUF1566 domain-containing protein [Rheinheimera baltica]
MITSLKPLFTFALLLSIGQAYAADCNDRVAKSTPTDNFVLNGDGTVTHKVTQLTWMRCVLGQEWQNNACVGEPAIMDWETALQGAVSLDFAGANNWRLPNVKELLAIVEERCTFPATNAEVFPGLPGGYYWTATSGSEIYNVVVDLRQGNTDSWYKVSPSPYLFLVRD